MKSVFGISLVLLALLMGCATQPGTRVGESTATPVTQQEQTSIREPFISAETFNPTLGQKVTFNFVPSQDGVYKVRIWDGDGGLIRELESQRVTADRQVSFMWDGRDHQGRVVPDEAYTFTVYTRNNELIYNPFATSGGERIDITDAQLLFEQQRIVYQLPYACRMLVRVGTKPGPLHAIIVDW